MGQITSAQLSEWEAYDRIDPIGTWRADYNTAALSALLMNIVSRLYAKKGQSVKEYTALDFMPNWTGEKRVERKQTVDEMKQALISIAAAAQRQEQRDTVRTARANRPPMAFRPRPPIKPR